MARLEDYRTALIAAHPGVSSAEMLGALDDGGQGLPRFIVDHGLGPLWHERTGRDEFYESRMQAEALFVAQEKALREIDSALAVAETPHVVLKGAATRLLLYENPALRACHDLDILVPRNDRISAASAMVELGFDAVVEPAALNGELVLARTDTDIDLHWQLVRGGRLRHDITGELLSRRRRVADTWMLGPEDTLFALLVHPAFRKHLAGWSMGLHRIADLLAWLRTQAFDWEQVRAMLTDNGVQTAAWATLRWTQLLSGHHAPDLLPDMLGDLQPGRARRRWLDYWLASDLSGRTSSARWARLFGFSVYLHDTFGDARRAALAGLQARRHDRADLEAFRKLIR